MLRVNLQHPRRFLSPVIVKSCAGRYLDYSILFKFHCFSTQLVDYSYLHIKKHLRHDSLLFVFPRRSGIPHRSRPLAKVYIYERLDQDDEAMLLHKYLEILLHEMIHAFIHIYICLCPSCEVQTARLEGPGGHGVTWHLLADAMEDFTARFLGLELDLGRGDAAGELEEEISRPAARNSGVDRMAEEDTEDDTTDGASSEELTDIPEYVAEEERSDSMYQS